MASNTEISLHQVTGVKLSWRYDSNGGARTIRIDREDGSTLEITIYGKTEDAEALKKSDDFRDVDADLRRLDRRDAFFEDAYPAVIESIKTIVSAIAGGRFTGPDGEDLYDALIYRIGEDLSLSRP